MRRAAKVDANQSMVMKALRAIGAAVEVIGEPVDLLVCFRGEVSLMEVKNKEGRNQLTKQQAEFIARWPGRVHIIRSPQEAVAAVIGEKAMA